MTYRNNMTSSKESARYVELVGMPQRQFETLVGVMAYHRVYGGWPSRPVLVEFMKGKGKPQVSPLALRGWLETRGSNNRNRVYAATDRAWRHLGVSRFDPATITEAIAAKAIAENDTAVLDVLNRSATG